MKLTDRYAQKCGWVNAETMLKKLRQTAVSSDSFAEAIKWSVESSILSALETIDEANQAKGGKP